jgi:predicted lipoprotein with Yx(FWY)xxD motif
MAGTAIRRLRHRDGAGTGAPLAPGRTWWPVAIAALACAAVVAGCGSGASASGPTYEVQARAIDGLGTIITDGQGFTLYMYAPDHQGPSQCYRFCAQQWPPLVLPHGVARPVAGRGVKRTLLGTVRRADGQLQETYDGWPLYLWQGDTAPGDVTGQGYDMGLWYTVSVTGAVDKGTPRS